MICWGSAPKVSREGGNSFLFRLIHRQEFPFSMSFANSPAIKPSLDAASSGCSARNSWMVPVGKTLPGKQASISPSPKPAPEAIGACLNPCAAEICSLSLANISCFSAVIIAFLVHLDCASLVTTNLLLKLLVITNNFSIFFNNFLPFTGIDISLRAKIMGYTVRFEVVQRHIAQ